MDSFAACPLIAGAGRAGALRAGATPEHLLAASLHPPYDRLAQRRLLEGRGDVAAKEAAIAEKEAAYALLRNRLSRLPDPAVGDQLAGYQTSLKTKMKQLRSLESELVRAAVPVGTQVAQTEYPTSLPTPCYRRSSIEPALTSTNASSLEWTRP